MKNYTITVNGKSYDVSVEEKGAAGATAAPVFTAPAAAPASAPAASSGGSVGNIKVTAGAAGKVFKITASVGAKLNRGEEIMILEVMKMETPVVAPEAGELKSIEVKEGDAIEAGTLLATLAG